MAAVIASFARAENWPRFRGPNGAGQSDATGVPVVWSAEHFLWRQALPGVGHSSPVVWEGRLFITSADAENGDQIILAYDALSGAPAWQRRIDGISYSKHKFNSYASSTPTVDAHHVYVLWLEKDRIELAALTHDGDQVWRRDVGPFEEQHGFGKSPIVVDGHVIVATDNDANGAIVAFDALSGDVRWRIDRPAGTTAFATPCLLNPAARQKTLLAVSTAAGLTAIDVASGSVLWQGFEKDLSERSVSSPIVAGGLVFISTGSGGNGKLLIAVRPGETNSAPPEAYRLQQSIPNVPTPVAAGDFLFLWHDRGVVSCHDVDTGRQHWRERVGGDFHSSPLRIGQRIYCASKQGEVIVLAASEQFRLLARNELGEPCIATPAVAHDRLYVRTESSLICIGQPASE